MTYDEMRIRQAWPYEVKIAHAEKVAREFIEKVSAGIEYGGSKGTAHQAWNVHISVGGLDSITLLLFLRDRFPNDEIKAISRSTLEDKSIQRIHEQLFIARPPAVHLEAVHDDLWIEIHPDTLALHFEEVEQ